MSALIKLIWPGKPVASYIAEANVEMKHCCFGIMWNYKDCYYVIKFGKAFIYVNNPTLGTTIVSFKPFKIVYLL